MDSDSPQEMLVDDTLVPATPGSGIFGPLEEYYCRGGLGVRLYASGR